MAPLLLIRATAKEVGRAGPALLGVWIYFNLIVNTILLPLLVGTFIFSKRAKRHPTLVNLCITWILSGVFSLLLFYAKQHVGPEPNKTLCIAQTTLLYGITPMWSVAVFMFFYYMVKAVLYDSRAGKGPITHWKLVFMLASPYITQIAFSVATLLIAFHHPTRVTREHRYFYCALSFERLSFAMSLFTLFMCIGILYLEVHLAIIAYRNHCGLREAGKCSGADFQFRLRVLVFGIYVACGMAANLVCMIRPSSVVPDMYAATAGTAVFLVFGTQPDVLRVWCFWRKDIPKTEGPVAVCSILASSDALRRLPHASGPTPGKGSKLNDDADTHITPPNSNSNTTSGIKRTDHRSRVDIGHGKP